MGNDFPGFIHGLATIGDFRAKLGDFRSDFRSDYDTQTDTQGTARDCAETYAETAAEPRGNLTETRERAGMATRIQRSRPGRTRTHSAHSAPARRESARQYRDSTPQAKRAEGR